MSPRLQNADEYDSPWKDALQQYLQAFLLFFFPDIASDIDWSRGYESLDKEFQRIIRRARVGERIADKLFKVWLRDGGEHWLLIHIEVQGTYEKHFAKRMFDYNSAIWQLYNREVASLAVLCDDQPGWRPTSFSYGRWQCKMELQFRIAKLLDFAGDDATLEASTNPFAMVVLAHLKAMETREDVDLRHRWKLHLAKGLIRGKWSKEDIRQLFRLIDWIMSLPDELEELFQAEVIDFEKEGRVEYISNIERAGFNRGMQEGLEKGIEQGIEKGIEQGVKEARALAVDGIVFGLEMKFGTVNRALLQKIQALDTLPALRRFARFAKKAQSLEDVRRYFD